MQLCSRLAPGPPPLFARAYAAWLPLTLIRDFSRQVSASVASFQSGSENSDSITLLDREVVVDSSRAHSNHQNLVPESEEDESCDTSYFAADGDYQETTVHLSTIVPTIALLNHGRLDARATQQFCHGLTYHPHSSAQASIPLPSTAKRAKYSALILWPTARFWMNCMLPVAWSRCHLRLLLQVRCWRAYCVFCFDAMIV